MIRGLDIAAKHLGVKLETKNSQGIKSNQSLNETNIEQIPMMYRAQVQGRCSLQNAGRNEDLEQWQHEWVNPRQQNGQPSYQHKEPQIGFDGKIYRIKIEFPFRLSSNCGQDSILRPVLGKKGIPLISGSSIKGLFRRACDLNQASAYCGDEQNLTPGSLRFHGAYPINDWAGTRQINVHGQPQKIRYRIVDVIHPQQERQVEGRGSPKAIAMISLYQPTLIFEFSSTDPNVKWQEVETILLEALQQGIGGKTSTGYGLGGHLPNCSTSLPSYPLSFPFKAVGVSPLLRSDEPEFRPNLFKATLRGHTRRLLGGVNNSDAVKKSENKLFGSSTSPGIVQIFWQSHVETYDIKASTPTYETEGVLHINAPQPSDRNFIELVVKFAFVMGGFGKSWRRVSHKKFYPQYSKLKQGLNIGCHWECPNDDWLDIKTPQNLTSFLNNLYQVCSDRIGTQPPKPHNWREAWHPSRVAVYSQVVTHSHAVSLFHDNIFKETPAIGGKNKGDTRPKFVSSVWHRMLPIGSGRYLEIVTLFPGDRNDWQHLSENDRLMPFVKKLEENLIFTWGTNPIATTPMSNSSKKPQRKF